VNGGGGGGSRLRSNDIDVGTLRGDVDPPGVDVAWIGQVGL